LPCHACLMSDIVSYPYLASHHHHQCSTFVLFKLNEALIVLSSCENVSLSRSSKRWSVAGLPDLVRPPNRLKRNSLDLTWSPSFSFYSGNSERKPIPLKEIPLNTEYYWISYRYWTDSRTPNLMPFCNITTYIRLVQHYSPPSLLASTTSIRFKLSHGM
jgi:hypothetical protein